ncbi:MAG: radical SAM family heme chaperone HemW [Bacteroidetes bacterium]|nr:radical SAM family heme chaperone HemW [Bacteroidota bacterium]
MAGIYIHIPYCKQQCTYCNFHFRIAQKDKLEMLKSMHKEIKERKDYLNGKEVSSIYFGGGTPSILSISEIKNLIQTIYTLYSVNEDAEITVECNPDDLTDPKLSSYKKIGVNRLSIGVQSFADADLKFMNRSHNAKEAIESIELAKKVGFENITIDLIYGLPNQTLKQWQKNLDIMFSLGIQHFSAYALTIEEKTPLYHLVKNKNVKVLSDKKTISQFNLLQVKAKEQGFIHYEISNFGKQGYFSKHNTAYWTGNHYLGIGPSAHSFNGTSRRWNISSNKKYIEGVLANSSYSETENLTNDQQYNEYIFTSLRTIWGIDKATILKRYGDEIALYFLKEIKKWEAKKYIVAVSNIYTLTSKGKIFADAIASDLFIV